MKEKLEKEYENYYHSLLKKGKLPFRDTKAGFWGCASFKELIQLFNKLDLKRYKSFLDLGSGDGKVVLLASLYTKSTGIEIDEELIKKSAEIRDRLNLKASFINKDFLTINLSNFDILFYNPDKPFTLKLENKITKEFKGTLIIYNNTFLPKTIKKDKEFNFGTPVSIYEV